MLSPIASPSAARAPVILDAVRSPMGRGREGGALAALHPVELLAQVLKSLIARNDLDPGSVEDVIIGCVSQVGEQSATVGRMAWLAAGFPEHVPATTIDRMCGSSQQAVHFAAQGIMAGAYDIVIAGGVESMSRVKMGASRLDRDPVGPSVRERYAPGLVHQGISAELVSARYGLDRAALDAYSARSHQRAAEARAKGDFAAEIVAITVENRRVEEDETIRPETTEAGLAALRPAFENAEIKARFPEIAWSITAGNASQITDGASAILLMSEAAARRLNRAPRARFVGFDVIGDDPLLMLTAPIPATKRVLKKAGLRLEDIDHIEVNEAFAPVPLAWARALGGDEARLNPLGGAIALGHPLGASGARLMTTMVHALGRAGRYGLQTMCEAGGMANATIIERL
jgi:acetyl-CoA C-acetyltransferase/acetyl-CoA acyltransferase